MSNDILARISDLSTNIKKKLPVVGELSGVVLTGKYIRSGESLSPLFFTTVIEKIMKTKKL